MNRLEYGMSLVDALAAPRFHHQWKPNELRLERNGFAPAVVEKLKDLGYAVRDVTALGTLHALERFPETGRVQGVPDPRSEGIAVAE
jgi:gamma-glutamyltranspeptidase/glutathione hydrolase